MSDRKLGPVDVKMLIGVVNRQLKEYERIARDARREPRDSERLERAEKEVVRLTVLREKLRAELPPGEDTGEE